MPPGGVASAAVNLPHTGGASYRFHGNASSLMAARAIKPLSTGPPRFGQVAWTTNESGERTEMRKTMLALAALSLTVPAMDAPAMARGHYYKGRVWQDSHGRWRCKRSNGTTGLIVGAAGGALIGRAIDTHGERATGTILGAVGGALIGRSIDRSRVRCR
jgi:hypothetical protein